MTETFTTGRSRVRVPAYLRRGANGDTGTVSLLITTEKAGGVVLLRIDHIDTDRSGPPAGSAPAGS